MLSSGSFVSIKSLRVTGLAALCLSGALLSGCTTVDDFRAMAPAQYAALACSEVDEVQSYQSALASEYERLKHLRGNVERGYALHRDCRMVRVPDGAVTRCRPAGPDGRRSICETIPRWRTVEECHDIPVPINVAEERQKLEASEARYKALQEKASAFESACREAVERLSPDDAYQIWESGRAPLLYMK